MKSTHSETPTFMSPPTTRKSSFVLTSYLSNGVESTDMIWMTGCRQKPK